jgi:hypothetical protein
MESQSEWNKQQIYTAVGKMTDNCTFLTIDNQVLSVRTYGTIRKTNDYSKLACVNLQWDEDYKEWILFQFLSLE